MKKGILFLMMSMFAVITWAQTSPYTGVAVGDIVSGGDYYLYNVESGLWLQNNDRKSNDWSTRAQLGCRGLDFQLNAVQGGYKINAKFGKESLNRDDYYLDNNNDYVWVIEAKSGSVSNAVTIKSGSKYLTADNYEAGKPYNNMYKVGEPQTKQWYLNNPENNNNGTWQIVDKAERLAKMIADGTADAQTADATWLIKSPDFANNDTRYNSWTKTGEWKRGGDADGDYGRGSMIIESWNSGSAVEIYQIIDVPNGEYELTLQGFYRDGKVEDVGKKYADGTEQIRAKYYANHVEADLRSIIYPDHTSASNNPDRWPTQSGTSGYYVPNNMADCSRAMNLENVYQNNPIQVTVTDGHLKIGVKKTGSVADDWVIVDNFKLTYLGPVVDLTPYLENLNSAIKDAEAFDGMTTDALQTALNTALSAAKAVTESTNADEISSASAALVEALNAAVSVDVSVLRPTVTLAKAEGIDVAEQENCLANGTTSDEVNNSLFNLRAARKVNALRMPDIYTGSAPAAGKVYLFNLGTGQFLGTGSDWNTHAAIDQVGIEITLVEDGDNFEMETIYGWLNYNAYVDTGSKDAWHFLPVAGKANVYNISSSGNDGNLLGYDPNGPTDGKKYWSTIAKDRTGLDNLNNQWKIITPAERATLIANANPSNPVDVSYLIDNPSLNRKASKDGKDAYEKWTKSGGGRVSSPNDNNVDRAENYGWEFYNTDKASFTQTIADIEPGLYEVAVQGFYRDGGGDYQANVVNSDGELLRLAYLTANDETAPLPNIASVTNLVPGINDLRESKNGTFPNMPSSSFEFFETGAYWVTVQVLVGNDRNLAIGVTKDKKEHDGDWIVLDNFRLTYLGPTTEEVEVTSAGYATYCSENALDFTNTDIKAYVGTREGDKLTFTQIVKVPANTGLLLVAEGGKKESVPVITEASAVSGNCLVGVNEQTTINSGDYILNVKNGGAGFYKAGSYTTLAAHRAYIPASVGGEIKNFIIDLEDDATAVSEVESSGLKGEGPVFNLSGQRLSKAAKGVNIINGKKILK